MKNPITITILFLLLSMSQANALPSCEGDSSEWNDCEGTQTFSDGTKYSGEYQHGKPNGQGTEKNPYMCYKGQWKDGKKHGRGTQLECYGGKANVIWSGEFKDGQRFGKDQHQYVAPVFRNDASSSSGGISELKSQYETYFVIKKCNETHILYVNPDELRQAKKSIRAIDDSYKSKGVDTDAVYKDAESNPSEGTKKMMNAMDIFFISGYNTDADAYCKLYLKALKKPEKPKGIKDF